MPKPPKKAAGKATTSDLTDGEWAFLLEYLSNGRNGTRAYMHTHPKASYATARNEAAKTLAKPCIRRQLERLRREARRKCGIEAERTLRELAALAYSDLGDVIDLGTMTVRKRIPPDARRAVAQLRVRRVTANGVTTESLDVRMHSKLGAVDKAIRHLGLYRDLPPLETILALLPPSVAAVLRQELARAVSAGERPAGAGGDPDHGGPGGGEGAGGPAGDPLGPGGDLPGGGADPGPVAGGVPAGADGPGGAPVLPAGGEDGGVGGEDAGPLFDHP